MKSHSHEELAWIRKTGVSGTKKQASYILLGASRIQVLVCFQKTFEIIRNTCNVPNGAGLKHYQTYLCFKTCFTNELTTFDSIQLRSSGCVRNLPETSTRLDEGRMTLRTRSENS